MNQEQNCQHTQAKSWNWTLVNVADGWRWCEGCGCLVKFKQEPVVAEVLRPISQRKPSPPKTA